MTILATDRKGYISKRLEITVQRQKCASLEAAFWFFTFLSDLVSLVKAFIHPLSSLGSATKTEKGDNDVPYRFTCQGDPRAS